MGVSPCWSCDYVFTLWLIMWMYSLPNGHIKQFWAAIKFMLRLADCRLFIFLFFQCYCIFSILIDIINPHLLQWSINGVWGFDENCIVYTWYTKAEELLMIIEQILSLFLTYRMLLTILHSTLHQSLYSVHNVIVMLKWGLYCYCKAC